MVELAEKTLSELYETEANMRVIEVVVTLLNMLSDSKSHVRVTVF